MNDPEEYINSIEECVMDILHENNDERIMICLTIVMMTKYSSLSSRLLLQQLR